MVDAASIQAITEAGAAAVSAGALSAGVASFETAVRLADRTGAESLRVETRLVLAEALIHTLGGLDEEGVATLTEAERIALAQGDPEAAARARAELGYVDFLRARYDRAERWFSQVLSHGSDSPSTTAKAMTYLGSVASDRAEYPRATSLLEDAVRLSRAALEPRREAFGLSMLGRISLLRGELGDAAGQLGAAVALAERDHWLSFLPWPQALLGQVLLSQGDLAGAAQSLEQSFARACQIGDPCWEGISARGLALVTEASGDGRPGDHRPPRRAHTVQPSGRPVRVARRPHPRRPVRDGASPRPPADPRLGGADARPGLADRDAGADRAGHAARRGPRESR